MSRKTYGYYQVLLILRDQKIDVCVGVVVVAALKVAAFEGVVVVVAVVAAMDGFL